MSHRVSLSLALQKAGRLLLAAVVYCMMCAEGTEVLRFAAPASAIVQLCTLELQKWNFLSIPSPPTVAAEYCLVGGLVWVIFLPLPWWRKPSIVYQCRIPGSRGFPTTLLQQQMSFASTPFPAETLYQGQ